MNDGQSLFSRVIRLIAPVPIPSFTPPPRLVSDGLWVVERRLRLPPAVTMPTRMTTMRMPGGGLLLHSPVQLDDGLADALGSMGEVEALVAPNSFHYLFAAEYLRAFPTARLFVAPGLRDRVPSLPDAEVLADDSPSLWAGLVDQIVVGPLRGLCEVVLFHRPSATLVLTDLAFNLRTAEGAYNALMWRIIGAPPRFGPSRTGRLAFLRDAHALRPYLTRIRDWPFERIIVAHGDIVEHDARSELERAFARYL